MKYLKVTIDWSGEGKTKCGVVRWRKREIRKRKK